MRTRSPNRHHSPRRVALLVGAWTEYGRGIIEGVWQYAERCGPWFLDMQPSEPDESTAMPHGWAGDGVIAMIHTRRLAAKLKEDLLGKAVHPPLSGVDIPVKRIGYEAAAQLDRLLHGKQPDSHEIELQPLGVTSRQSTDLVACDDDHVRQAMRFIRDHAHEGGDVRDLIKAVPMARRSLERRFQDLIGRSPAEEIRRTKIEKVRRLLGSTDLPIPDIAEACGFNYIEHMIPIFRKYHGCTPSQYRKNVRAGR